VTLILLALLYHYIRWCPRSGAVCPGVRMGTRHFFAGTDDIV